MALKDLSLFRAMRDKDRDLYDSIPATASAYEAMLIWIERYPDDFPERGNTPLDDISAIKPRK